MVLTKWNHDCMSAIEQDTRFLIDNNLINKGWILDINNPKKNVFFESDILRIIENPLLKKTRKKPDYVLLDSENKQAIAVIEAKAGGKDLEKALDQAMEYASILNTPLIFAMNNKYCQTRHLYTEKPLFIDEKEVNELIRQREALEFIKHETNEIYITPKEVLISREELINIFKNFNNTLRGEGLRAGIERLSEFANILFLKLYTENKEENVWDSLRKIPNNLLIKTVNNLLKHIEEKYNASVFTELQIKKPETLREIINKLDKLKLSTIDADIKGDAFEYFLQQATSTGNDLGEYFTPRHITKTIINLVNPRFKEKIYDPFCGTGGFLTEAFNHIKTNTIIETNKEKDRLKEQTVFGREITTNARLAKMNMILHGDGHSGVEQTDTLENPVDEKYDAIITNMPFSQKTTFSHLYYNNLAKNNGDGVCLLHCFRAIKKGGRMALIVPEGFLFAKGLADVRKFLLDSSVLKTVVSLPQGVFLPYTGAKTYILYFTDCKIAKTEKIVWFFNVKSDGYSLNNKRKKVEENDLKKIDYANFSRKSDKNTLIEIGFKPIRFTCIDKNNYDLRCNQYETNESDQNCIQIGDFVKLYKGKSPLSWCQKNDKKALPYLNINFFENKDIKYALPNEKLLTTAKDDLLIIGDGQRSGMCFIADVNGIVSSTSYLIKNIKPDIIDNVYLYLFIVQKFKYLNDNKYGSAIPHLDKNLFLKLRIPLPSKEEQQSIRKKWEEINIVKNRLNLLEVSLKNEFILQIDNQKSSELIADKQSFVSLIQEASKPLKQE